MKINVNMLKKILRGLLMISMSMVILGTQFIAYAGLDKASSQWNLSSKGRYYFSGEAEGSKLYTNYNFTGKSSYTIFVNNLGNSQITVKLYQDNKLIDTKKSDVKVPKNGETRWTVKNLDSTKSYYIVLSAPCNFKGYIE